MRLRVLMSVAIGMASLSALAADAPPATVVVPASVEAFEVTDLFAKTSGYVSQVEADIGDHVKAGQVVAVIDVPEMEKELAEAKALLQAKARLYEAAEASVKQSQSALGVAKHQLERYRTDAQFQEVTLKRQQELFQGKAITDQQLDESRNKSAVARADVGVAESKTAAAEADVIGAEANREVAKAQVAVAEAAVARIETLLKYTKIVAPYDGVVTKRAVNRGDLVQSGTANRGAAIFTVQRVDKVRVFCEVPQAQVGMASVGTAAAVSVYGVGGEAIAGKVTRSSGALDPVTRTLRVEIDLANPGERLMAGMYAQVTLTPQAAAAK